MTTPMTTPIYLTDIEVLCAECRQPIRARVNTQQWIRVEWIGPGGECLSCYQKAKHEQEGSQTNRISTEPDLATGR